MRLQTISLVVFGCACLMGAGCLRSNSLSGTPSPAQTSTASLPTKDRAPVQRTEKTVTPKEDLLAILTRFHETKSFKARATSRIRNVEMNVVMSFIKPNRFYGRIQQMGSASTTEMIIVDTDLYLRIDSGIWVDLTKAQKQRTLGEAMTRVFTNATDVTQFVTPSSTVDVSADATRECTLYTVRLLDGDVDRQVRICAVDSLPKFVETSSPDQTNTVEYFDYNTTFTIVRPI